MANPFDLRIVISGLYYVELDAAEGAKRAESARVVFIHADGHRPRLTVALDDLDREQWRNLEGAPHYLDTNGRRYASVEIEGRDAVAFGETTLQGFEPLSTNDGIRLVDESRGTALDIGWALCCEGVAVPALKVADCDAAASFYLPSGWLSSSDLYLNDETKLPQRWEVLDPAPGVQTKQQCIADDLVLLVRALEDLEIRIASSGATISLKPATETLTLSVSNDMVTLAECGGCHQEEHTHQSETPHDNGHGGDGDPEDGENGDEEDQSEKLPDNVNPFRHLRFFSRISKGEVILPQPVGGGETPPNNQCNGLVAYLRT